MKIRYIIAGLLLISLVFTIAQPETSYNPTTHKKLNFELVRDGIIKINNEHNTLAYQWWVLTGDAKGIKQRYASEDFDWTWSKSSYNYSIIDTYNETSNEPINRTINVDLFTAYNDNVNLPVYWKFKFDEMEDPKWGLNITNNLGRDITNMKLWIIHSFDKSRIIGFNSNRYNLTMQDSFHFTENINTILPRLSLSSLTFYYSDLINYGFTITDIYIGNGSIVGYPNKLIVALGVTKGTGTLRNGYSVYFDPQETSYVFPDTTEGQWTNHAYLTVSDNSRAETTAVGQVTNVSGFDFSSIPASAIITSVYVRMEGRCYSLFCTGED